MADTKKRRLAREFAELLRQKCAEETDPDVKGNYDLAGVTILNLIAEIERLEASMKATKH